MNFNRRDLCLYLVTDRRWLGSRNFLDVIEEALRGGVSLVQLREKDLATEDFYKLGLGLKELCRKYQVPFLINDNVEVAKRLDADGVHIGQSDMAYDHARRILGPDKIIGVSASTLQEALRAQEDGADYIGVGAVFPTGSKDDAYAVGLENLRAISEEVSLPIVAIGGINRENILEMKGLKIDGVSLISAILKSQDIYSSAKELLKLSKEAFYEGRDF